MVFVLALLIGATCYVCGWKIGITLWGIGLVLALMIVIAMHLIDEGE